jgi:monoamine oxidase
MVDGRWVFPLTPGLTAPIRSGSTGRKRTPEITTDEEVQRASIWSSARYSLQLVARRVAWHRSPGRRRLGELATRPASDAIGRSHGRIHFAGEHTTKTFRGMESAMESGERAASEILARM